MKKKQIQKKQTKLIADHIDLEGEVIINGKKLDEGKDFTLDVNGIELSENNEKLLDAANSYSFYFSRRIIK
jgi:hypothetical protein